MSWPFCSSLSESQSVARCRMFWPQVFIQTTEIHKLRLRGCRSNAAATSEDAPACQWSNCTYNCTMLVTQQQVNYFRSECFHRGKLVFFHDQWLSRVFQTVNLCPNFCIVLKGKIRRKLAAATADRVVHLFDESGEKKDKFSTKPVTLIPHEFSVIL